MKTMKTNLLLVLLILGTTLTAQAQTESEWKMILNNDHTPFSMKMTGTQLTYYFNSASDTLTFSKTDKQAVKPGTLVEIRFKDSNKLLYTSGNKNINPEKTAITIRMAEVSKLLTNIQLANKPLFELRLREKNTVKSQVQFIFVVDE